MGEKRRFLLEAFLNAWDADASRKNSLLRENWDCPDNHSGGTLELSEAQDVK
jgi:hypothetical protein